MAAKTAKTGIYIDAQKLYNVIYAGQFEMDKRDRPLTALRLLDHTERFIANFSLAYNTDDKLAYIEKMIAEFEIIKFLCRFAITNGMFKKTYTIGGIKELIVKMDEGIVKWHKFVKSARQE